uniref:Carbonyl reductase n=1 Tax=Panagrolaimus sp. JU765 TaxID=591449 RepID=A0AC34RDQ8_9BILA
MSKKVFVVSGANKGIGYGIVENFARNIDGGIIYLTETLGSKQKSKIVFHQLDIADENSVKKLAEYLKKTHGGLDILINNAGVLYPLDSTVDPNVKAEETFKINYYGTKRISKYLIPLIRDGGRIINVCSQGGVMNCGTREPNYKEVIEEITDQTERETYKGLYAMIMAEKYSQSNVDRLVNAKTEADIDAFVEEFKKSVKNGNTIEHGFPTIAYRVSKAAEIALTMLHHRMFGNKIKINACCPGYVKTDMSQGKGFLTIQEGADTPCYLATDPNAPNGKFLYQRKIIDWY